MDKSQNTSAASPGYETRDANVRGVFNFLVILSVVLVGVALLCWGLFRYFSVRQGNAAAVSPFSETRQLPLGPELQVDPRQDFSQYHELQEKSLESYAWENRASGTVQVPIELAMELLLRKGLPVQTETSPAEPARTPPKTSSNRKAKP